MRITRFACVVVLLLLASARGRAQDTTLVLEASIPGCSSGVHLFGWLAESETGVDPSDVPEPPVPPGLHLSAAFSIAGAAEPNRWRHDFRAPADFAADAREKWVLTLATNAAPATCNLSIVPGLGTSEHLWLVFTGAIDDTLRVPLEVSCELATGLEPLTIEVLDESLAASRSTWGAVKHTFE